MMGCIYNSFVIPTFFWALSRNLVWCVRILSNDIRVVIPWHFHRRLCALAIATSNIVAALGHQLPLRLSTSHKRWTDTESKIKLLYIDQRISSCLSKSTLTICLSCKVLSCENTNVNLYLMLQWLTCNGNLYSCNLWCIVMSGLSTRIKQCLNMNFINEVGWHIKMVMLLSFLV